MAAALLAFGGLVFFASSQTKHTSRIYRYWKPSRSAQIMARTVGAAFILLSLLGSMVSQGSAFGILLWVCLLSVAGLMIGLSIGAVEFKSRR